jgi:hypothetical protein
MRKAFVPAIGAVLLATTVWTTGAVAGGTTAPRSAPQAITVTGYMVDQACLSGDIVQVMLTAKARSTSKPVQYQWDFTNNGSFDTPPGPPSVTTTYGDEVNVTALVKATNPANETDTDTVTFGTLNCS